MKLNIQLFATSGIISGTSTATNCSCRIVWNETSRDMTNRTITIKVSVQIYKKGSYETTGTFSGTLGINGTSYSISKKFSPYKQGTWGEVANRTVIIQNASNKSVPLTTQLTQGGTSMAGTYKASGYAQLDLLFDPPVVDQILISEINPLLIGKVSNDVFVDNLSIKRFQISASFDETATATKYTIFNNSIPYNSNTNIVELSCINNNLVKNTDGTVQISASVQDTNGSVGNSDVTNYSNVPYTIVNLIETSTTVKRNGQTSGKAYLNVQGSYFNKNIGSIIQSGTYKPTIKYKFWEYGSEEPATYSNTINSDNITISDGVFNVYNLEIGSTSESASNYFNPEKAYRFKIQVSDNFTSYESTEKSIAVGEALWSEYKDRVNFKALTIKHQPILMPYTLYENENGATGNITLNETSSNFSYLEIFYFWNGGSILPFGNCKVNEPNGKTVMLIGSYDNGTYLYHEAVRYTINGTALNRSNSARWRFATGSGATTRTNTTTTDQSIRIVKVVGYK